jgi:hypothetical protein
MNDRIEIRLTDAGAPFDPRTDIPASSREDSVLAGIEGGVGWPLILGWWTLAPMREPKISTG